MKKGPTLLVTAATILGGALRADDLGRLGLGSDEGHSAWMAAQPLGDLPRLLGADSAPPFYYALLHFWQKLFPSDLGLRSLSLILGTAAIPVMYLIGRRLLDERAGIAASFFMAVSNFQLMHSEQVKCYALFFLVAELALLALLAACAAPERRLTWAAYGCAMAALLYTHAVAAFVVAGLSAFGAVRLGRGLLRHLRPFLGAHLLAGILFLPWLGVAVPQTRAVAAGFWAARPGLLEPFRTWSRFLLIPPVVPAPPRPLIPELHPGISGLPLIGSHIGDTPSPAWLVLPWAAFLVCLALVLSDHRLRPAAHLLVLPAITIGGVWIVSRLVASVYVHRVMIPALIPIPLIFAAPFAARGKGGRGGGVGPALAGAARRLRPAAAAVACAAFVLMGMTGYHYAEVRESDSWREAAAWISAGAGPGDAIVYDGHFGQIIMDRYLKGIAAKLPAYGLPSDWYDGRTPTNGKWVTSEADLGRLREAAAEHGVIWFVRSHTGVHDRRELGRSWCERHLVLTGTESLAFVEITRWTVPARQSVAPAAGGDGGA